MELGLGVHGEPGVQSSDLGTSAEIAQMLVDRLLADAPAGAGSNVAVLLNGLGSTTYEELFVLYRDIHLLLGRAGLDVEETVIGEMVTSLNMEGCSLSLFWLDDLLRPLWNAPASSPAFSR
jgi:dihydroxyacetone kinase